MSPHLSAFSVDRLALGALSDDDRLRAEQHLASCAECSKTVEVAAASRAHFTQFVAPRGLPARALRQRWWAWPARVGAPLLLAAGLLLFIQSRRPTPNEGDLGIKGGPLFTTFVRHGDKVAPLRDGATLHPGDQLRFVVVSGELPYLLIVSIDGAGHPSLYYPAVTENDAHGSHSGRLTIRTRMELPGSIVLDDAPGPERLFALFSQAPLPADVALHALSTLQGSATIRAATKLPVAADAQVSLLFEKSE